MHPLHPLLSALAGATVFDLCGAALRVCRDDPDGVRRAHEGAAAGARQRLERVFVRVLDAHDDVDVDDALCAALAEATPDTILDS